MVILNLGERRKLKLFELFQRNVVSYAKVSGYISKLENVKGNIQFSTLIRIFEQGLNKRID